MAAGKGWGFCVGFVVSVCLACIDVSGALAAESINWRNRLSEAQYASVSSGKGILLYFSGSGQTCAHYDSLFSMPGVITAAVSRYEMVRLDFDRERELAARLNVFKAGTILVYDKTGKGLITITDALNADEFVRQLSGPSAEQAARAATPRPTVAAAKGTPASRPTVTPLSVTPSITPTPIPKGRIVAGPVAVSATSESPQPICTLQAGKNYVAVFSGVFSISRLVRDRGTDACFRYEMPLNPGQIFASEMVEVRHPDGKLYPLVAKATGVRPAYNTSHIYELPITGDGQVMTVMVRDTEYRDNSGSFKVQVYERGD